MYELCDTEKLVLGQSRTIDISDIPYPDLYNCQSNRIKSCQQIDFVWLVGLPPLGNNYDWSLQRGIFNIAFELRPKKPKPSRSPTKSISRRSTLTSKERDTSLNEYVCNIDSLIIQDRVLYNAIEIISNSYVCFETQVQVQHIGNIRCNMCV